MFYLHLQASPLRLENSVLHSLRTVSPAAMRLEKIGIKAIYPRCFVWGHLEEGSFHLLLSKRPLQHSAHVRRHLSQHMLTYELRLKIFLSREQLLIELACQSFKIVLGCERLACRIHQKTDSVSPTPCSSFRLKKLCVPVTLTQPRDP